MARIMARILVVDDDVDSRDAICETLASVGHAVFEAGDGIEALAVLDADAVDLIVLDLLMPRMNGLELLVRLKTRTVAPPVIAISGSDGRTPLDRFEQARGLGAHAVLRKPFDLQPFLALIDDALNS